MPMSVKTFWLRRVPASRFLRIHRSLIVAESKVDSVSKNSVQLVPVEIPVGELYKDVFKALLARGI